MSAKHYHSSALTMLELIKAKPLHTAEDAVKAFDAIRAILLHAANLSQALAAKTPDNQTRRNASSMALLTLTVSSLAEKAASTAAETPSPASHLSIVA